MVNYLYPVLHSCAHHFVHATPYDYAYSSIASASSWHARPFCFPLDLGTEASLSIICRDTDTMLSSMSSWLTSEMSAFSVSK